jgi:hypothetical protein
MVVRITPKRASRTIIHFHLCTPLDPSLTTGRSSKRYHTGTPICPQKLLLVWRKPLVPIKVLVDDIVHTLLAVAPNVLRAVVPKRLPVLDQQPHDVVGLAAQDRKVEAGEEAGAVSEGIARLVDVGLHDGVVLRVEVELDKVADFSDNVCGSKGSPLFSIVLPAVMVDDASRGDRVGCGCGEAEESGSSVGEDSVGDHSD